MQFISTTLKDNTDTQAAVALIDKTFVERLFAEDLIISYLFWCIMTTIFLTFGAPFWNDIASALLRIQKGKNSAKDSSQKEVNNG
jgi:hypothetical protein